MQNIRPQQVGAYIPNETFPNDEKARKFWRLSFRGGRDYIRGMDANGQAILVQHEREEQSSYLRRLRVTKLRNYVGPIIRRYNDLVFRKPPVRDIEGPFWQDLYGNVDGTGKAIDPFMKDALMVAQIDRECYLVPDVVRPITEGPQTVAGLRQAGSAPSICRVSASAVVNWVDYDGSLEEVLVVWMRDDGSTVLRWWGEFERQDFPLDQKQYAAGQLVVTGVDAPVLHGYNRMPVVRLRPNLDPLGPITQSCGDSQAGPMAESQQAIVNLLSLLNEEISNVTFSQMIASGVSADAVKDVQVGNTRVLCLPNPASKVDMIGADPAQAQSIRDSLNDEKDNLLTMAGATQGAGEQVQSGMALAFRHNDLATIVAALANAVEAAEFELMVVIAGGWGQEVPTRAVYQGKDADLPEFAGEATTLLQIAGNSSLPSIIRLKVAERFARRNLSLSDDELKRLEMEMQDKAKAASALRNGFPLPRMNGNSPPAQVDDDAGDAMDDEPQATEA